MRRERLIARCTFETASTSRIFHCDASRIDRSTCGSRRESRQNFAVDLHTHSRSTIVESRCDDPIERCHFNMRAVMPRFAILTHDHPFPHWDFLLENGDRCRTWRLLASPDSHGAKFRPKRLPDHRLMYLDYEGPVSLAAGKCHAMGRRHVRVADQSFRHLRSPT